MPVLSWNVRQVVDDIVYLRALPQDAMRAKVKTVNIEDGMPSVAQAQTRLSSELQIARQNRVSILKVIHGYGSSGVGGDLRIALQSSLRQMKQCGQVRDCIFGENWRKSDDHAWELLKQFPELKDDRDFGRQNRGITIVVL
jgi:hypothetical protein